MSSLLINEPPLQVLPSLAAAIGLNEAIALQQLHYWLAHAKKSHDGKMWIYKTYAEWKAQDFPFWSERTIQRTFLNLEKLMIVLSAKLADNKHNKVNFYTIDYEVLAKLEIKTRSIPCKFDSAKLASSNMTDCHYPLGQNGTIQDDKLASSLRDKKESNKENKEEGQLQNSDGFIVSETTQQPTQEVTEAMIDDAIAHLVMQKLLNPFELFNREAIRFELINSQQYKKPAKIALANFIKSLPVDERIARFQTLAQSEVTHPSHIVSAPAIDDAPKLSREEKLARIAQIERGEI